MNIKRALGFSFLAWIFIFVIWSLLIFIPVIKDLMMLQYVIYWILLIPLVLLLAKWYFREDPPTLKTGLLLGVFALVVMFLLDLIITIPLFIMPQHNGEFMTALSAFYSQWEMWVGFAWFLALLAYAGWEFDQTFTKGGEVKSVEPAPAEELTEKE